MVASDACQTSLQRATRGVIGVEHWQVPWRDSAAGAYILYIVNNGITEETVTYRIDITR